MSAEIFTQHAKNNILKHCTEFALNFGTIAVDKRD